MGELTTGRKRFFTGVVFMGMWLMAAIHASNGVLQNSIIGAFSLTDAQKGVPSSVMSIASGLAFLTSICLVGRVRKPVLLLFGALLSAFSLFLLSGSARYAQFLIGFMITGYSVGLIDSVASASIADLYTGQSSVRVMCALHAVYGLSGFIMPIVYERMLSSGMAWQSTYLIIGVYALVMGACVIISTRGVLPKLDTLAREERFQFRTLLEFMHNARLRGIFLCALLFGMFINAMLVWTPRYIGLGLKSTLETAILPAVYLGIVLSRLLMSIVRVDSVKVLRVTLLLSALLIACGVISANEYAAFAGIALGAFFTGPSIPFLITLGCKEAPNQRFLATALVLLLTFIGQMLFAPIFGGVESAFDIHVSMLLATCVLACAGGAAFMIRKRETE